MNVRKFIATNARDALRKVKETLGADAIILSNRGVPGGVEIMAVAARDMAMIVPTPVPNSAPSMAAAAKEPPRVAVPKADEEAEGDYLVSLGRARAQAMMTAPAVPAREIQARQAARPIESAVPKRRAAPEGQPAMSVNAGIPRTGGLKNLDLASRPQSMAAPSPTRPAVKATAEVVPAEVMDEIRALRKIVEQHMVGFAWGEAARSQPVKAELLRHLLDTGFSPAFARDLLADLPAEMDAAQALAWVKGAADRLFYTIGTEADIVDRGGVYALVGPTGVGKTTTTAKLAARCVLRHGAGKVALVTTDSYRIGAHEQLRIYGRILGVSVYLAKNSEELRQCLVELQHKHIVLIDTMGMSQKDRQVPEMTDMLEGCNVQRLLVLSATSRGDTLDDVVRAYDGAGLSGCILSKVDEAASLASSLDVIMRHGLCLHYVSNGQRVPEDLHLPNRSYLLHRAFKDVPDYSPYRHDGMESAMMMANAGMVAAGGRRG